MLGYFKRLLSYLIPQKRFEAAKSSPYLGSWQRSLSVSFNEEIDRSLYTLQARSYSAWQNSGFFKKYLNVACSNVIGPKGFTPQPPFKLDNALNKKIWDEILKWWERFIVSNTFENNDEMWIFAQRVLTSCIIFGESLVVKVKSKNANFGFKYLLISGNEIANFNDEEKDGVVKGGIHFTLSGEIQGYYLDIKDEYQARWIGAVQKGSFYYLESSHVIRVVKMDLAGQLRGIPWIHAGLVSLKHLNEYRNAELVAARISSSKMGFFLRKDAPPMGYTGIDPKPPVMPKIEPGSFTTVPDGYEFSPWDPTHPTGSYGKFTQSVLLEVAASLNVSLSSLSGDTSNINFSTIRATTHEEREGFELIQKWFSQAFVAPVFKHFLEYIFLKSTIDIPFHVYQDLMHTKFTGRKWSYVDPIKDIKSQLLAVQGGIKSRTRVCEEMGLKWPEVMDELQNEQLKQSEIGLNFNFNEKQDLSREPKNEGEDQGDQG